MILKDWNKLPADLKNEKVRPYYKKLKGRTASLISKRIFDILVALIMVIILSPVFIVVAVWIKLDSEGPVFYRQERITTYGKTFGIFKFRTMVINADKIGSLVTLDHDPRITKVGRKIRKCRLDEIPQLLNILKGEMTFVGTRPEVARYVDMYTDEMKATLLLPAGVTSLASIKYKDEDEIISRKTAEGLSVDQAYVDYVLPDKMKYNLEYIDGFSFWGDIKLMWTTFVNVILR